MFIMMNRKCGKVKGGGLYLVGEPSPDGTLLAFTAIAAPFEARIAHPRNHQIVDVPTTLLKADGLRVDGNDSFAGLPKIGIADLWGKSAGYTTVWDVIAETATKGISRRVAHIPDIPRPFPILMMHMNTVLNIPNPNAAVEWLLDHGITINEEVYPLFGMPWRGAESLGHVGDKTYLDHPYVALWAALAALDPELMQMFLEYHQIEFRQGVCGLSWITQAVYVLKDDETDVPEELAEKGVIAGIGESDPRAAEFVEG